LWNQKVDRRSYITRAREQRRAETRWKLVVVVATVTTFSSFGCAWLWTLRYLDLVENENYTNVFIGRLSELLIGLPGALIFAPISFIFGNIVGWCIPPARRALDKDAREGKSTGFGESCRMFMKLQTIMIAIMLPLIFLGLLLQRLAN
jgi:hypothetical protein